MASLDPDVCVSVCSSIVFSSKPWVEGLTAVFYNTDGNVSVFRAVSKIHRRRWSKRLKSVACVGQGNILVNAKQNKMLC